MGCPRSSHEMFPGVFITSQLEVVFSSRLIIDFFRHGCCFKFFCPHFSADFGNFLTYYDLQTKTPSPPPGHRTKTFELKETADDSVSHDRWETTLKIIESLFHHHLLPDTWSCFFQVIFLRILPMVNHH